MTVTIKQIEDLRQKRNIGSKKIAEFKKSGKDITELLSELKKTSQKIKMLERAVEQEKTPEAVEVENYIDTRLFEKVFANTGSLVPKNMDIAVSSQLNKSTETEVRELESRSVNFPQNSLDWGLPWFTNIPSGNQNIFVMIRDENKLIGFGCFLIFKSLGGRVIKSAPFHYGDFYNFVIDKNYDKTTVESLVVDKMLSLNVEQIILEQVNSHSTLFQTLDKYHHQKEVSCSIYSIWLKGESAESVLAKLSSKMRASISSKLRKLEAEHKLEIVGSTSLDDYEKLVPEFRRIVRARRGTDLSDEKYARRLASIQGIHKGGAFKFFYLKVDNEIAAFRIGFLHQNVYFEWKSCHDSKYNLYSLGDIMTWLMIKEHMRTGITAHNFMAGEYVYKQRWSTAELTTENLKYVISKKSFRGWCLNKYQFAIRPLLKRLIKYVKS